jgi:hypothetical protein
MILSVRSDHQLRNYLQIVGRLRQMRILLDENFPAECATLLGGPCRNASHEDAARAQWVATSSKDEHLAA